MGNQLVTLAQLEEYHLQKVRRQRREYNARHPEIILQQRIRSAANLLRKHGFVVVDPDGHADHAQDHAQQRQGGDLNA